MNKKRKKAPDVRSECVTGGQWTWWLRGCVNGRTAQAALRGPPRLLPLSPVRPSPEQRTYASVTCGAPPPFQPLPFTGATLRLDPRKTAGIVCWHFGTPQNAQFTVRHVFQLLSQALS